MSALTRATAAVLLVLSIAFSAALGSAKAGGGDGGWINLPGGRQLMAMTIARPQPVFMVVRSTSEDLQLRVEERMAGAVALITAPAGGVVVTSTQNRVLTIPSDLMKALGRAGMNTFSITFVSSSGLVLRVRLLLDPDGGTVTVRA